MRNGFGADAGEKIIVFCASITAGASAVTSQGSNRQCSAAAFAATPNASWVALRTFTSVTEPSL
ncbi:hypothetical protein D3C81_2295840 [compost metagenome]